jgi:hypothetical protein
MPDPSVAQLGVSGVIVALLIIAIKVVWTKYQDALAAKDAITATVLPLLQQTQAAVEASTLAIDRVTRLYEQRIERPGDRR